ncbi:MAG TPA: type I restriction enzyme HsdR N-terminal domain-containing protein, partial [Caulobacteraceae bacterium]|nr:type I restriction enzyme HsdR N-terminal domain-containing protein [Caulobacteraceae bacterium]
MDLGARLTELQQRTHQHRELLLTEEAAKTALVMPFLQALGYDVFNPSEVVPEFTADVGTKKGEKIDYAICSDGKVSILVECKISSSDLNVNHASQLYRYFSVTDARLAILTNGV